MKMQTNKELSGWALLCPAIHKNGEPCGSITTCTNNLGVFYQVFLSKTSAELVAAETLIQGKHPTLVEVIINPK